MSTCVFPATDAVPVAKKLNRDSERQLIARAKRGDEEAFAALFDAHKKHVYSLCLRMVGNSTQAEDLTQDAFMQVFRKLQTFRGDAAFSTWLYRIAVNTALMMFRKHNPPQISLDEPIELKSSYICRELGGSDSRLAGTVDRINLVRAMNQLPTGYRRIFILHEVEGYEHSEIAALLHCSVGNSKSQLHKAKLKIREFLLTDGRDNARREAARESSRDRGRIALATPPVLAFRRSKARPLPVPKTHEEKRPSPWRAFGGWEVLEGLKG